jgi:gamma-glutamyltranspeptidase / glutathione hydrolase
MGWCRVGRRIGSWGLGFLAWCVAGLAGVQGVEGEGRGLGFAVAAGHPRAVDVAVEVFEAGGNAVDAAVAAALMLGVVDGHNSGIGGGCFFVIRTAGGELVAIDGRERAPAAAGRDMYVVDGELDGEASRTGALAVAVPGALRAFELALEGYGRKGLAELLVPAAQVAAEGFLIDGIYARRLAGTARDLRRFEGSAAIFLKGDGSPYEEGEVLVQKDLAASYEAIAREGVDWFYEGEFARRVGEWMAENGGLLTAEDMAGYEAVEREPVRVRYRGHEIVSMPPPSSGGIHVGQILGMLELFDGGELGEVGRAHVLVEAMKLAFADRAHWLGDPDHVGVPRGLLDAEYVAGLAGRIELGRAAEVEGHGLPPAWDDDVIGRHTTHLSCADGEGNWVALTLTVNTAFGSKVVVPGTGVILNNEMDDFSVQPGVPNAFGLLGAEANAIAPGKRPLSSMSPTLVLDGEGEPWCAVGAAGGPTIISQVVQVLGRLIDDGSGAEEALAASRLHHQWSPDRVRIERGFGDEVKAGLRALGHELEEVGGIGVAQLVVRDREGRLRAAADGRGRGAGSEREPIEP